MLSAIFRWSLFLKKTGEVRKSVTSVLPDLAGHLAALNYTIWRLLDIIKDSRSFSKP